MSLPHAGFGCRTRTISDPGLFSEDATLKPGSSDKSAHSTRAHSAATPTRLSGLFDALVEMRQTDYIMVGAQDALVRCHDDR
jgi:hypothetical protein